MSDDDMPKGAVMMTQHLDLLTEEPLELAVALRKLAESKSGEDHVGKQWTKFAEAAAVLVSDLQRMNEPSHGS